MKDVEIDNMVLLPVRIGDMVYLKTDTDQYERMVTGMTIRPSGIQIALAYGTSESWHYVAEISKEKDVIKTSTH